MGQHYELFERFKAALLSSGDHKTFLLGSERGYDVYYVPFEYVNAEARLVLVGITPGPEQMKCAYATARQLLRSSPMVASEILRDVKQSCAFIGMREKINEMLDHFVIPRCVKVAEASSLWRSEFAAFQPTSIVPNAAFRNGAYFNGPFSAVLDVPLLRNQFEKVFIPSVERINKNALFIGMGPVVDEALTWCALRGVLDKQQILGYFPRASGASGSQFAYFTQKPGVTHTKTRGQILPCAYACAAARGFMCIRHYGLLANRHKRAARSSTRRASRPTLRTGHGGVGHRLLTARVRPRYRAVPRLSQRAPALRRHTPATAATDRVPASAMSARPSPIVCPLSLCHRPPARTRCAHAACIAPRARLCHSHPHHCERT